MHKSGFNIFEMIPLSVTGNSTNLHFGVRTISYYKNGSEIRVFPDEKTKNDTIHLYIEANKKILERNNAAHICI